MVSYHINGQFCLKNNETHLNVVDLPAMPVITNISAGTTSITVTWEQNLSSAVFWYELQYNFTIRECESNIGNVGMDVVNGSLRSYTLKKGTETPVEEDSIYTILLTAMNSDGASDTSISEISTLRAGM